MLRVGKSVGGQASGLTEYISSGLFTHTIWEYFVQLNFSM